MVVGDDGRVELARHGEHRRGGRQQVRHDKCRQVRKGYEGIAKEGGNAKKVCGFFVARGEGERFCSETKCGIGTEVTFSKCQTPQQWH